jgi:hypothetical protein
VGAAFGHLPDRGGGIAVLGVDRRVGPEPRRVCELSLVDVDRADAESHGLAILNRQMSKPARAGDGQPLSGSCTRDLDALVGGDAGADDGRDRGGGEAGRDVRHVVRVGQDVFGEASVFRVATELGAGADGLPAPEAVFTVTAGAVEPRYPDAVALLNDGDPRTDRRDEANPLVAGDEREARLQGPVSTRGVQIGVADPARLGLDEDLPGLRRREVPLAQDQWLSKLFDDGGVHLSCQGELLGSGTRRVVLNQEVPDFRASDVSPEGRGPTTAALSAYAGSSSRATRTSFLFTNSWMPMLESSRP